MDSDLIIPIFWTVIFGTLIAVGYRRLTSKFQAIDKKKDVSDKDSK